MRCNHRYRREREPHALKEARTGACDENEMMDVRREAFDGVTRTRLGFARLTMGIRPGEKEEQGEKRTQRKDTHRFHIVSCYKNVGKRNVNNEYSVQD